MLACLKSLPIPEAQASSTQENIGTFSSDVTETEGSTKGKGSLRGIFQHQLFSVYVLLNILTLWLQTPGIHGSQSTDTHNQQKEKNSYLKT